MKHSNFAFILIFLSSIFLHAQSLDTLVDVGGYNLHFNIIKGEGIPILFESGAGNDGSVWNNILDHIYEVTGTTLITYDRSGFGKSELNPDHKDDSDFGILNGMKELESGLKKLGYEDEDLILVSHSYGGFYTSLYSSRHPEQVKYVVMIDANHVEAYTDDYVKLVLEEAPDKKDDPGGYNLSINYGNTVDILRNTQFPPSIPVIDLIQGIPHSWATEKETKNFEMSHQNFVKAEPNRIGMIAHGSRHYIFKDNPALVINAITKAYSGTLNNDQQLNALRKALDKAIELSIEAKKQEIENLHSESDFNSWGYELMRSDQLNKALEVFKLNVLLYSESSNVYDSYGEALMNANRDEEAIEMYEKLLELDPNNENGKKMIEKIKQRK